MFEHISTLSQEIMNPSNLFTVMCVTQTEFSPEAVEDIFVTFINDYSKFSYTYLLKSKDEVLDWFKVYKAEAENQLEKKIKILRSDRGESIPQMIWQNSAKNTVLFMR